MENLVCNWTPKLIVDLIKSIAWPVVVLLIGIGFRNRIFYAIRSFFSRNTVSEVSASASGLSAKFVAAKQSSETLETASSNSANSPNNMNLESLRDWYNQHRTAFSEEIYQGLISHLSALNVSNEEKIELLATDLSLIRSEIRYLYINKVLFRSQFNLFSAMAKNDGYLCKEDAERDFISMKARSGGALTDWDWIKYIAYPVSNNLIYEDENGYKLTMLGKSYVAYMSKNPQLIDELAKL